MATEAPTRRPYHGSCHCGELKYILFMALPPTDFTAQAGQGETVRIYKCNCSVCHKMGFFHIRPKDQYNDFLLLSPTDPFEPGAVGNYQRCNVGSGQIHWVFCAKCGVRTFGLAGEGETVEVDLGEILEGKKNGKTTKVWKLKAPKVKGIKEYVSVNATSLEPGQEGLDLREWTEKGWVVYIDQLGEEKDWGRGKEPFAGGMY